MLSFRQHVVTGNGERVRSPLMRDISTEDLLSTVAALSATLDDSGGEPWLALT
jgi:hypothetical protein